MSSSSSQQQLTPDADEAASIQQNQHQHRQSIEEVWFLKEITFRYPPNSTDAAPKRVKIITQNFNGPCSFIAICNILILRGDIEILPYGRENVSYEFLSQLVGEYLLLTCPDVDISAALSIMPYTRKGMDLNPLFTGATSFRPAGATGGELKLFAQANIKLVHGWLVDPDSPEYPVLQRTKDYDSAVNLIAEADHVANGNLVVAEGESSHYDDVPQLGGSSSAAAGSSAGGSFSGAAGSSSSAGGAVSGTSSAIRAHNGLSLDDKRKIEDAIAIRTFIDHTQSQLTYYGLFTLASLLAPGALVALFRNSHLSVLYKSANPEDSALYTLVTDYVFLHEPSVVWERIEDVEGGASTFVDSDFVRSSPAGGDYAGHTAESALAAMESHMASLTLTPEEQADAQLARQLQHMEDEGEHELRARNRQARMEKEQQRILDEAKRFKPKTKKKDRDCIIM
ncbi:hypothetical protein BXZ70DRAFT_908913 [Cristinia sonorae]|uniref:MINDY deubiquitinase domain-containing protein n=1 Tax=Cristinia sonorae TaxID=1940300 RepID=A0A8K0UJX3_9AGAR|nr:hypothetical protein BXZ70DRAFT_908913 [Cristinia sonorae]